VAEDYLVVDFEHRGEICIPRTYLEQDLGHGGKNALLHSYCLTTYAAQADTYGVARHLGSDHSTRAELYVGLTRGRHNVTLYGIRRCELVAPIVDDNLPRLQVNTSAARAMASSAAAGGVERLAIEIDPLVHEAATLASRHRFPEIIAMVERADVASIPLARRTYEIARRQIIDRAISEPPEAERRILGHRPTVGKGLSHPEPGDNPLRSWDNGVGDVAIYKATHATSPFPSDNPTDELRA
jgi:hypothetical protein